MTQKPLRSGLATVIPRIVGRIVEIAHPAKGYLPLLFLGFLLMIWFSKGVAERPGKTPIPRGETMARTSVIKITEKPAEVDALIDAYRQASMGEKALLMQKIRSRIVDEVTEEQQTTIAEIIRLKKLQAEERRYAQRHRKSSGNAKKSREKTRRKKVRSLRACQGLECTFNRVKRSFREFFHKATVKRRHPANKPRAEDVLKGKVE